MKKFANATPDLNSKTSKLCEDYAYNEIRKWYKNDMHKGALIFTTHSRTGLTKLRHACPEWYLERFPWHAACIVVQIFFNFFFSISISILWSICVYIHLWLLSDCVRITVANKQTWEWNFLHKSGAKILLDISSLGRRPGCDWANMWHGQKFYSYNLFFKQDVIAPPVTS